MNLITLILRNFLILFGYEINSPARLKKKNEKSQFDKFCNTIAPYILVLCIILLTILLFVVLIKYGGPAFGTEANHYYNGQWR